MPRISIPRGFPGENFTPRGFPVPRGIQNPGKMPSLISSELSGKLELSREDAVRIVFWGRYEFLKVALNWNSSRYSLQEVILRNM